MSTTLSKNAFRSFISKVKVLLFLVTENKDEAQKIKYAIKLYDVLNANTEHWTPRFKEVIIKKAHYLQKKTTSYSFWLYLDNFLEEHTEHIRLVPPKNWWKQTSTKD